MCKYCRLAGLGNTQRERRAELRWDAGQSPQGNDISSTAGVTKEQESKKGGLENVLQKTALLLSHSDVTVQQAGFCSDPLPCDGAILHLPQQGSPTVKQVQENQDMACVRA